MYIENYHRKLKHINLEGNKTKRVDKVVKVKNFEHIKIKKEKSQKKMPTHSLHNTQLNKFHNLNGKLCLVNITRFLKCTLVEMHV